MTTRLSTFAAAAALSLVASTTAFAGESLVSTVDGPRDGVRVGRADAAATQSPGTVGAMHYAVGGRATSSADVARESRGQLTAATVRWRAAAGQPGS